MTTPTNMESQDPALDSFRDDIKESGNADELDNPERGCGHLEPGKAYIRGVGGDGPGILPAFVRCDPVLPHREIGTNGSFTRGYKQIDGLTMQINLERAGGFKFVPLAPVDYNIAIERMVEAGYYELVSEVPESETDRHIDRIGLHDLGGDQWGEIDSTTQTDLLMRVGETHYPEPEDFIEECVNHGLSKAIPVSPRKEPPTVIEGVTRCWLMHPNALPNAEYGGGIIGYTYIGDVVFTEPEEGDIPEYVKEYESNGQIRTASIAPPEEETDPQSSVEQFAEETADQ